MYFKFLQWSLLFSVILEFTVAMNEEWEHPRSKRAYKDSCGTTHLLEKLGKVTLKSPNFGKDNFPANFQCHWNFLGSRKCIPQITCAELDLNKSPDCETDFLGISDAVGGELKLCGNAPFKKPIIATEGAKDLYISFEGKTPAKGFHCQITCAEMIQGEVKKELDKSKVDQLPKIVGPYRKEEHGCVCGLGYNKNRNRIVGGVDAKMSEFPWQAALVGTTSRKAKCGASIINNRYILTAAHCVVDQDEQTKKKSMKNLTTTAILTRALLMNMLANKTAKVEGATVKEAGFYKASGWDKDNTTDDDEDSLRFKIEEVIPHPLYMTDLGYDYDVALIKIDGKIDITDPTLTPVCLPHGRDASTEYDGRMSWVAGWGKAGFNASAGTRMLQKLMVPVISFARCQITMKPHVLTYRMLCAGYNDGTKDACTGDSGGPLMLQGFKQWTQIGVVSWGEQCAKIGRYGVFSRLTEMYQWINFHVNNDSPSEGVKWCRNTFF